MRIIGIDPGKKGWICELDTLTQIARHAPIPYREDGILCKKTFSRLFDLSKQSMIILEKVSGDPRWGSSASMTFGKVVGYIELMISDYPFRAISPRTWQADLHRGYSDSMDSKEKSLAAFRRLNPNYFSSKKPDHNMIDSFLIAEYGLRSIGVISKEWSFERV